MDMPLSRLFRKRDACLGSRFRPKPKTSGLPCSRGEFGAERGGREAMATPGREKLRRRREEQKVRALAAIEPSSSRVDSNSGRGSIVARGARQIQKNCSRQGEKR
jgi:hypothetical protein